MYLYIYISKYNSSYVLQRNMYKDIHMVCAGLCSVSCVVTRKSKEYLVIQDFWNLHFSEKHYHVTQTQIVMVNSVCFMVQFLMFYMYKFVEHKTFQMGNGMCYLLVMGCTFSKRTITYRWDRLTLRKQYVCRDNKR